MSQKSSLPQVTRFVSLALILDSGQAPEFSAQHILQYGLVEGEVRNQLLQLGVLVLKHLQPPHLVGQQPVILLPPVEVSGISASETNWMT